MNAMKPVTTPSAVVPMIAQPFSCDSRIAIVYEPHGTLRAITYDPTTAAFIIRACNSHAALCEALEAGLALVTNPDAEASDADAFEHIARHALKAAQS